MERKRSPSPNAKRVERPRRSRSRSPEKDREKADQTRDRRRDDFERRRSRSPRRHRSKSPRRPRSRSRSPRRKASSRPQRHDRSKSREKTPTTDTKDTTIDMDIEGQEDLDEDEMMSKMMGFSGFDSTKGKHVPGACNASHVKITKPRKYRQYMNRRGGFNRPLDYVI